MLLFSSIVEYRVFVYACVFLNRIASFEKLKNNNNEYHKNVIWPRVFAILFLLVCLIEYANSQ